MPPLPLRPPQRALAERRPLAPPSQPLDTMILEQAGERRTSEARDEISLVGRAKLISPSLDQRAWQGGARKWAPSKLSAALAPSAHCFERRLVLSVALSSWPRAHYAHAAPPPPQPRHHRRAKEPQTASSHQKPPSCCKPSPWLLIPPPPLSGK